VAGHALDNLTNPDKLPPWITEADLDYMSAHLKRMGFRGGLNWYRNVDKNWEMLAPWIRQPALFIAGSEDHVIQGPLGKAPLAALRTTVPNSRPGVDHPGRRSLHPAGTATTGECCVNWSVVKKAVFRQD